MKTSLQAVLAVGAAIIGSFSFGAYTALTFAPDDPSFRTFVVWADKDNRMRSSQWLEGAFTEDDVKDVNKIGAPPWPGVRPLVVFTVQGKVVDSRWAKSVSKR